MEGKMRITYKNLTIPECGNAGLHAAGRMVERRKSDGARPDFPTAWERQRRKKLRRN